MPYIGNSQVAGVHQNNFKILDDISSYTETFVGSSSSIVDTTNNTIKVPQHRFYHGQRVTYNNGGGSNIGGLTSGTVYYAVADSHQTIKLAASLADALSNTVINILSVGSGSSHTLNSSFDGVSKKFKLTHSGGIGVNLTNASHATVAINNVVQRPNLNDASFTEGFAIEGGKVIVFKTAPTSTDTFWGNTIAEAVSTFDTTDHIVDSFTADGTTTNFSLSKNPPSIRDIHITLDGVTQHTTAFSLQGNVLIFSTAPANGTAIQVKHMGFVGATTSGVTGFYGRVGNVALEDGDVLRGDGSLITGLNTGIPGISTSGISNFFNVGIAGTVGITSHVHIDKSAYISFGDNPSSISGLRIYNTNIMGTDRSTIISKDILGLQTILGPNLTLNNSSAYKYASLTDTDNFFIQTNFSGTNAKIIETDAAKVKLNYLGNTKLQTSGIGITVTGEADINGNLNVSGVSTFSGNVTVTGIGTLASQFNYFGPKIGSGSNANDHGISLIYNGIASLLTFHDASAEGFVRSYGDLYFLVNADQSTGYIGGGYGLRLAGTGINDTPPGSLIPYTLNQGLPNLGRSAARYGTVFAEQLNISGVSTFAGDLSVAENIVHDGDTDTKINFPPAGNIIRFNTNGQERLRIQSGGSVGLGTNNPEARLDIYDDNTSSTGLLQLSQKGTGDASINFKLVGAGPNNLGLYDTIAEWTAGVDNSDNDKFKINTKSILGHSSGVDAVAITTAGNVSVAKDFDVNAGMTVAGISTFSDALSAANYAGLKAEEGLVNVGSLNGDFNIDLGTDGHVYTAPGTTGGNYTPNYRFDPTTTLASKMNTGDVVSSTLIVDSSSHYCTSSIKIDGNSETVEWVGGSAPSSANGSGYDIYSFTIVKVNNNPTYIVIGNAISAA